MYIKSNQLFTKVVPISWCGRVIQFPITRIFIAISFLIPISLLNRIIKLEWLQSFNEPFYSIMRFSYDLLFLVLFMVSYRIYTRYIERRKALELSSHKFLKELGLGALISFGIVTTLVVLMMALGFYKIEGFTNLKNLTDSFRHHMMVGFSEELLFRLIIFKLIEEYAGSWWALIVQGLIFGFAHMFNPNGSVFMSLAITANAILLGSMYMFTRRIWLIMGLHWCHNFFQTGVYGMPCSGIVKPGFIQTSITGPAWLTGGAWGIEASYIHIVIIILIGLYIIKLNINKGSNVPPSWKRKGNIIFKSKH